MDDIIVYNNIGIAFTTEIDLNFNDVKYINASGEFMSSTDKINLSAISVSFPWGISINPSEIIGKEIKYYRSKQDLQWRVSI